MEVNQVSQGVSSEPVIIDLPKRLDKIINKYKEQIKDGPRNTCACCGCLHFNHFVKNFTEIDLSNCLVLENKYKFVTGTWNMTTFTVFHQIKITRNSTKNTERYE